MTSWQSSAQLQGLWCSVRVDNGPVLLSQPKMSLPVYYVLNVDAQVSHNFTRLIRCHSQMSWFSYDVYCFPARRYSQVPTGPNTGPSPHESQGKGTGMPPRELPAGGGGLQGPGRQRAGGRQSVGGSPLQELVPLALNCSPHPPHQPPPPQQRSCLAPQLGTPTSATATQPEVQKQDDRAAAVLHPYEATAQGFCDGGAGGGIGNLAPLSHQGLEAQPCRRSEGGSNGGAEGDEGQGGGQGEDELCTLLPASWPPLPPSVQGQGQGQQQGLGQGYVQGQGQGKGQGQMVPEPGEESNFLLTLGTMILDVMRGGSL